MVGGTSKGRCFACREVRPVGFLYNTIYRGSGGYYCVEYLLKFEKGRQSLRERLTATSDGRRPSLYLMIFRFDAYLFHLFKTSKICTLYRTEDEIDADRQTMDEAKSDLYPYS
jgi:hypothetical protein